ncbi:hypothetical protein V6N13_133787 [Hibiscus sabdariffa]|uniref:Uncharacterized protein n=2 Tax=Hibiscus sabdariffa TaxID=183260 RepID=A0ABR2R044_9ROSI
MPPNGPPCPCPGRTNPLLTFFISRLATQRKEEVDFEKEGKKGEIEEKKVIKDDDYRRQGMVTNNGTHGRILGLKGIAKRV